MRFFLVWGRFLRWRLLFLMSFLPKSRDWPGLCPASFFSSIPAH